MINANDNSHSRERRIDVDDRDGGAPYLVSLFKPDVQPEPVLSEMFEERDDALAAAHFYADFFGISRINDSTEKPK